MEPPQATPQPTEAKPSEVAGLNSYKDWIKAYRHHFPKFKFYLDGIEQNIQKRLQNRIAILGGTVEPFFSNKCTHVVTTKPVPEKLAENLDNVDGMLKNAHLWGIKVWPLEKLQRILSQLLDAHSNANRGEEDKQQHGLNDLLEEEKMFGLKTNHGAGAGNAANPASRPKFIPFKHQYLIVEDVTGIHRPIVIKEYYDVDPEPTWPTLKKVPRGYSPFAHKPRKPATFNKDQENVAPENLKQQPQQQQQKQQQQQQQEFAMKKGEPLAARPILAPLGGDQNRQNLHKPLAAVPNDLQRPMLPPQSPSPSIPTLKDFPAAPNTPPVSLGIGSPQPSSHMRPSGFQPTLTTVTNTSRMPPPTTSGTTSRLVSTSGSVRPNDMRRQLAGGNKVLAKLDRRMIDNKVEDAARQEMKKVQERAKAADAKRKRELELSWCENCNKRFRHYKEHIEEKSHQAFVKDQNNFKEVDSVLATVQRELAS